MDGLRPLDRRFLQLQLSLGPRVNFACCMKLWIRFPIWSVSRSTCWTRHKLGNHCVWRAGNKVKKEKLTPIDKCLYSIDKQQLTSYIPHKKRNKNLSKQQYTVTCRHVSQMGTQVIKSWKITTCVDLHRLTKRSRKMPHKYPQVWSA